MSRRQACPSTDRFLPDKAIDLIDEACSRLNLDNPAAGELPTLEKELDAIHGKQDGLLQEPQNEATYEKMAELKSRELQIDSRVRELRELPTPVLTADHLAGVHYGGDVGAQLVAPRTGSVD